MSRIELATELVDDFDRICEYLANHDVRNIRSRIEEILHAISVLEFNPLIGRPAEGGTRELVIGRRSHGYVTLYRYVTDADTVLVLALRSQKEAGYAGE